MICTNAEIWADFSLPSGHLMRVQFYIVRLFFTFSAALRLFKTSLYHLELMISLMKPLLEPKKHWMIALYEFLRV